MTNRTGTVLGWDVFIVILLWLAAVRIRPSGRPPYRHMRLDRCGTTGNRSSLWLGITAVTASGLALDTVGRQTERRPTG
jgi:hypothetical protein